MNRSLIAVDLAKDVFQIAELVREDEPPKRKRTSRKKFLRFFAERRPALVVMEACGTAHYWGREIAKLGHEVRLLPPQHTSPYLIGNKSDARDTDAILEASRNTRVLQVPVKSVEHQVLTTIHRIRSSQVRERTRTVNSLRGHLRELGVFIPTGRRKVLGQVRTLLLEGDEKIPMALRFVFESLCDRIEELGSQIDDLETQLRALAKQSEVITLLMTIPGIGLITATALFAWVGEIGRFKSGRQLASFLGLTPREKGSGPRHWSGSITKKGNSHLRGLLIHGARSVLRAAKRKEPESWLGAWALGVDARRGHNIATVAIANKLARIAYAVWKKQTQYKSLPQATSV